MTTTPKKIGQGTYGKVYKVSDNIVRKDSRIKTHHESYNDNGVREACFFNSKYSNHKHIVKSTDIKISGKHLQIFMEDAGKDLWNWAINTPIRTRCKMLPNIVFQISSVLLHLEEFGMIHGDLKPTNIMIDSNNHVRVCDWGSIFFTSKHRTFVTCTHNYAAPELLVSPKNPIFSNKNDVFSLGLVVKSILFKVYDDTQDIIKAAKNNTKEYTLNDESFCDNVIDTLTIEFIELCKKMLTIKMEDRISIREIYNSPVFDCFRESETVIVDSILLEIESPISVDETYMVKFTDINIKMRSILIDWLYKVSTIFKSLHCFTLSVDIIDRYLSHSKTLYIGRNQLICIGISCLYIAEMIIYGDKTSLKELKNTGDTYTIDHLEEIISNILVTLEFDVYRKIYDADIIDVDFNIVKSLAVDKSNIGKNNIQMLEIYNSLTNIVTKE